MIFMSSSFLTNVHFYQMICLRDDNEEWNKRHVVHIAIEPKPRKAASRNPMMASWHIQPDTEVSPPNLNPHMNRLSSLKVSPFNAVGIMKPTNKHEFLQDHHQQI